MADDAEVIDPAAQLGEAIKDMSDQELLDAAAGMGFEQSVDMVFEQMPTRFHPDRARGQSAVVHWTVETPDGPFQYEVTIDQQTCTTQKGTSKPSRTGLTLSFPDMMRLAVGQLNGMDAFMRGRLRITGDPMFAQTFQSWFQ